MDNQYSSPQIVFPNVPDDFCPSGNWTEVFQTFIDDVLANGTVNINGLAQLSQIDAINSALISIENQLDAIIEPPIVYSGIATGFIQGGDSNVVVTLPSPLPTTDYSISLTMIMTASGISTNDPVVGIVDATKTTTGFTISLQNNGSTPNHIVGVQWGVVHQ